MMSQHLKLKIRITKIKSRLQFVHYAVITRSHVVQIYLFQIESVTLI